MRRAEQTLAWHVRWLVTLAWCMVAACGSPVDERWDGKTSGCQGGEFPDDTEEAISLLLDGPVTAHPDGQLRRYLPDGSQVESEIRDARYMGVRLGFHTETTTSTLGAKVVTVTEYDLVRLPDKLQGVMVARSGDVTRTCAVEMQRAH